MAVTNPPEEVMRALAGSHNTIALLLLLLLHFVVTHIMSLACVVLGSAAIIGLDRRLRSHADAQVRPSPRFLYMCWIFQARIVSGSNFCRHGTPSSICRCCVPRCSRLLCMRWHSSVASRLLTTLVVVNPLPSRQVLKNRFVLLGVAVTAVLFVVLSAAVLNKFPEGGRAQTADTLTL